MCGDASNPRVLRAVFEKLVLARVEDRVVRGDSPHDDHARPADRVRVDVYPVAENTLMTELDLGWARQEGPHAGGDRFLGAEGHARDGVARVEETPVGSTAPDLEPEGHAVGGVDGRDVRGIHPPSFLRRDWLLPPGGPGRHEIVVIDPDDAGCIHNHHVVGAVEGGAAGEAAFVGIAVAFHVAAGPYDFVADLARAAFVAFKVGRLHFVGEGEVAEVGDGPFFVFVELESRGVGEEGGEFDAAYGTEDVGRDRGDCLLFCAGVKDGAGAGSVTGARWSDTGTCRGGAVDCGAAAAAGSGCEPCQAGASSFYMSSSICIAPTRQAIDLLAMRNFELTERNRGTQRCGEEKRNRQA